jgi:hypothetical protein
MQKEWRICRRKFLLSTMPDEVFRENLMGDRKPAYNEQIMNFIFGYF